MAKHKQVVFDLQSVRLLLSDEEYKMLVECKIPNSINDRLLEKLTRRVEGGEGIIENWEEL